MYWTSDRPAAVEQRARRECCRAGAAAVRDAVTDANRAGVPVDTIAVTSGFSPGYVRMILDREHAAPSRGWAHGVQGDRAAGPPP
ncbi:hypothetical protein ABIA38_001459 [Embleya sp. AB8]